MAKIIKLRNQSASAANVPSGEDQVALEKEIRDRPAQQHAYQRLMVIYRKMKAYKKELAVIAKAIKTFELIQNSRRTPASKQVSNISRQLNKAMQLSNKSGRNQYESALVAGWRKRMDTVKKKIRKA